MAQQLINLGATGSGAGGDSARTAFEKAIANFAELYIAALPGTAAQKQAARDMFGLGTAATKAVQTGPTDSTPGSMMAVGAFGLGSATPPSPGDLDNPGSVTFLSIPSGSDKNPFGTIGGVGLNLQTGSSWGAQLFAAAGGTTLQIKARNRTSAGVWGPLFDLFHTGNILGTVSQSGGVPTGAIIEYGSNANGRYVRFADGTQICIHSRNGGSSWTFPAVFSDTPYVYATVAGLTSEGRMVGVAGTSTTSTSLYLWTAGGTASTAGANLLAVGRWY